MPLLGVRRRSDGTSYRSRQHKKLVVSEKNVPRCAKGRPAAAYNRAMSSAHGTAPTAASEALDAAARRYAELLRQTLGDNLVSVVLFGSVARGEARPDSDIDLLIVDPSLGDSAPSSPITVPEVRPKPVTPVVTPPCS